MNKQKIREALEAASIHVTDHFYAHEGDDILQSMIDEAIASLDAEQDGQKPVAEWVNDEQCFQRLCAEPLPDGAQLYTHPPASPVSVEMSQSQIDGLLELARRIERSNEQEGLYISVDAAAAIRTLLAAARPATEQITKEWRCYHCDEIFTTSEEAQHHFGRTIVSEPICRVDQKKYRAMEAQNRRYCEEDTDLHREINHLIAQEHVIAQRAEEAGYARGLKDAVLLSQNEKDAIHSAATEQAQAREPVIMAELLLRSVFTRPDLSEQDREKFFAEFMRGDAELSLNWGDFRMMAATARASATPRASAPSSNQDAQDRIDARKERP